MGDKVFSPGTVVTWQKWTTTADPWTLSGTATAFKGIKSVSGGTRTRTVADVTTLLDTTIDRRPVKRDLGTVQLTFNQLADADTTNERVKLDEAWDKGDILRIVVDFPGDWDNIKQPATTNKNQVVYDGFINSISKPPAEINDDPLTYTVELTLVLPHEGTTP